MAAHHNLLLRPPPPPAALRPPTVSVPAPPHPHRCRARPRFSSLRPPPPPAPPSPLPKKRADHEAAADPGEEASMVADDEAEAEAEAEEQREHGDAEYAASVGAAASLPLPARLRAARAGPGGDPLFFLLTAVAVATSVAFTSMVAVAIPTMLAMRRAANSFTMLADAALEELPSTMAAVRLSGMEISDLTLELSDLRCICCVEVHCSHEIADGVNKSAKVAETVRAGIGQIRDIAQQQAMSMIEERANLQTIPTSGPGKKSREPSSPQQQRRKGPDV
ncbi:hypothetical protein ACP4OV_019329 [Aristida adscensionis]